jgi:hypothetical protein
MSIIACLSIVSVGRPASGQVDTGAEIAVWRFLAYAVGRGEKDSEYWKKAWRLDIQVLPIQLTLGPPFERRKLDVDGVKAFAKGADLVGAAILTARSYPVYNNGQFIGAVDVAEGDSGWAYAGRGSYDSPLDSLAIALVADGYMVSTITSKPLGALIVARSEGRPEKLASFAPWVSAELSSAPAVGASSHEMLFDYGSSVTVLRSVAERHVGKLSDPTDD